jgi:hypothetical protein
MNETRITIKDIEPSEAGWDITIAWLVEECMENKCKVSFSWQHKITKDVIKIKPYSQHVQNYLMNAELVGHNHNIGFVKYLYNKRLEGYNES